MSVDTTKYLEFVDGVTSEPSKDLAQLLRRISELEVTGDADVPHLLTAYGQNGIGKGYSCEGGDEEGRDSERGRDEQPVGFNRKRAGYRRLSRNFFSFCAPYKGFCHAGCYGYSNG